MRGLTISDRRNFMIFTIILGVVLLRIDLFGNYLSSFFGLISPLLVGVGIAFLLNRPMIFFEKLIRKIYKKQSALPRITAVILSYILLVMFIIGIISVVVPQLIISGNTFYRNLDQYQENLENLIEFTNQWFVLEELNIDEIVATVVDVLSKSAATLIPNLLAWTSNVFTVVVTSIFAVVFSFYFLIGKEKKITVIRNMILVYGKEKVYRNISYLYHITVEIFNKYVIGQITEAMILATLCYLGMKVFGFEYSLLISVLIGITALVPIVGAYVGGGIAFFLLVIISPMQGMLFLVYLIVLQQVENTFIYPHVVGTSLGLPPLFVMLAVIIGGGLFGFTGMILGVPVMAIIFTVIKNDLDQQLVIEKEHINEEK
ncbi:MAG: AI-2E family transporter [Culicoidibacterales bacterium]